MSLERELATAIRESEGRSTTLLSEAAHRYRNEPGYLDALVLLSAQPERDVSDGATWMLKAALQEGRRLSEEQLTTLLAALPAIEAWQAQLHLCQSIAMLGVPKPCRTRLAAWLRDRLDAPRPFLRAWALDALCHLEGKTEETLSLLDRMSADKAASVRARARALNRDLT